MPDSTILPDAPLIRRGPYRFLSHPNYAVVVAEVAVLPLTFGLFGVAVAFSVLNALVPWVRIRAEARALAPVLNLSRRFEAAALKDS